MFPLKSELSTFIDDNLSINYHTKQSGNKQIFVNQLVYKKIYFLYFLNEKERYALLIISRKNMIIILFLILMHFLNIWYLMLLLYKFIP